MSRAQLLQQLTAMVVAELRGGVVKVAIDGVDAAGKTTLADELAAGLADAGVATTRISIDGFHNPAAVRHARESTEPAISYYQDSFDYEAFRRCVLHPLAPGGDRRVTPAAFDHLTDSQVACAPETVSDGTVVIVDGIFLGRPELRASWDVWIFLTVSPEVARRRGTSRDSAHIGSLAAAERRYRDRYEPGQRMYIDEANPLANADIVVDNTDLAAPEIVRADR